MQIRPIEHGSPDYQAELELRNRVLRVPLGLCIYDEPLEAELQQWHYGLFDDRQLVGCVVVVPKTDSHAKIRQMAIDDGQQRKGLGRLLLTSVERAIADRGIATVELAARLVVAPFYVQLGYHQVGSEFVEVGITHVEMRKQLT